MSLLLKCLKAFNGDCLLVSFDHSTGIKNILIDGGIGKTYKDNTTTGVLKKELIRIAVEKQCIDLLIITHIDDDHIAGILKLFADKTLPDGLVKKVWFNDGSLLSRHFKTPIDPLRDEIIKINSSTKTSYRQGIALQTLLAENGIWEDCVIVAGRQETIGNCLITVLSPDENQLEILNKNWAKESYSFKTSSRLANYSQSVKELQSEDLFEEDNSVPNGSSIAIMLEYGNKRLLLLADAHPSVIVKSLISLGLLKDGILPADLVKISHHGSKGNTSPALLSLLSCDQYLISTNGLKHGLPDKIVFARILQTSKTPAFIFNYDIVDKIFNKQDRIDYAFTTRYLNQSAISFND